MAAAFLPSIFIKLFLLFGIILLLTGGHVEGAVCSKYHTVADQDTVSGVANQYGETIANIRRFNPEVNAFTKLQKGSKLCVQPKRGAAATAEDAEKTRKILWPVLGVVLVLVCMFIVACIVSVRRRRKKTEGKLMAHGVVPKYSVDHKPVASSPSVETKHIPG